MESLFLLTLQHLLTIFLVVCCPKSVCLLAIIMEEEDAILDDILPAVRTMTSVPIHNGVPLTWEHKVNLVGEKCPNPRIHCCDSCRKPILRYGRLIPCKHIFCLDCAQQESSSKCKTCSMAVIRIEETGLGTVFRCRRESCHRTYLSQRDLLAHIKHRHSKSKSRK